MKGLIFDPKILYRESNMPPSDDIPLDEIVGIPVDPPIFIDPLLLGDFSLLNAAVDVGLDLATSEATPGGLIRLSEPNADEMPLAQADLSRKAWASSLSPEDIQLVCRVMSAGCTRLVSERPALCKLESEFKDMGLMIDDLDGLRNAIEIMRGLNEGI